MSNSSKMERELAAQAARIKAMKYLASVGESLPQSKSSDAVARAAPSRDNTLDLVLQSKARNIASNPLGTLKSTLLSQQSNGISQRSFASSGNSDSSAAPPWSKVLDHSTNLYYYWNVETNETSWEKPAAPATSSSIVTLPIEARSGNQYSTATLPEGWVELVHAATKQVYFYNEKTGEKLSSFPSSSRAAPADTATGKRGEIIQKKRISEPTDETQSKKPRRMLVDPLDFTGGSVSAQYFIKFITGIDKSSIREPLPHRRHEMVKWLIVQLQGHYGSKGRIQPQEKLCHDHQLDRISARRLNLD